MTNQRNIFGRSRLQRLNPPNRFLPPDNTGIRYEVHGKRASLYEWRVAQVLDQLEIDYIFQVDYLGGRSLRGGLVLDFVVFTAPLPTPVWVHGEYWHGGKQRTIDIYQQVTLDFMLRGQLNPAVVLWGKDLQTDEQARATVKREMR